LYKVYYKIPKQNETYLKDEETYAQEKVNELCEDVGRVQENAKLVIGTGVIYLEYKFITLLDEGYKSFLAGLYHSTVSICSIALERFCYDLIESSEIRLDGEVLNYTQKKSLFDIPFHKLVMFLWNIGRITAQMKRNMELLNGLRNKYVHPLLEGDAREDAAESINLLCKIISSFFESKATTSNGV
jgi:hypothetical protein